MSKIELVDATETVLPEPDPTDTGMASPDEVRAAAVAAIEAFVKLTGVHVDGALGRWTGARTVQLGTWAVEAQIRDLHDLSELDDTLLTCWMLVGAFARDWIGAHSISALMLVEEPEKVEEKLRATREMNSCWRAWSPRRTQESRGMTSSPGRSRSGTPRTRRTPMDTDPDSPASAEVLTRLVAEHPRVADILGGVLAELKRNLWLPWRWDPAQSSWIREVCGPQPDIWVALHRTPHVPSTRVCPAGCARTGGGQFCSSCGAALKITPRRPPGRKWRATATPGYWIDGTTYHDAAEQAQAEMDALLIARGDLVARPVRAEAT